MTFPAERAAREERAGLIHNTEPHVQKLQRGERLSVEERTALEGMHVRIAELNAEIRSYEAAALASAEAAANVAAPDATRSDLTEAERREADFSAYLKRGVQTSELRAAGEAAGSSGGYLVPPGWWQRLQVAMKAFGGTAEDFEQLETESGQPMQWATVDPTTTVGQLVGSTNTTGATGQTPGQGALGGTANENQQVGDLDYAFGQGTLSAYMYTSGAQKVSFQLANDAAFNTDKFVSARVGESLGRAKALAAISGSGSAQPLGIITALAAKSSAGTVGTGAIAGTGGRIVLATAGKTPLAAGDSTSTELLTNTLNPATLRSMIAAVDPAYRALGAKYYMNDNQLLGLRGQVDSNGRPLINLQDGLTPGVPTTLWGYEIKVDQNIPNLAASTTGGPIFGHLGSAMVLRTVNQSGLLRLSERYADLLQVGYIGYMRFDIRSNDLRAAVTVTASTT
jgi:HK97 family phage major capsid protein